MKPLHDPDERADDQWGLAFAFGTVFGVILGGAGAALVWWFR
jgi:hypothetical protein